MRLLNWSERQSKLALAALAGCLLSTGCAAPPMNPYGPCKSAPPVHAGDGCAQVLGPEDFVVISARGERGPRLIVSADNRRKKGCQSETGLFSVPVLESARLGVPVKLELDGPCEACLQSPHGISLVEGSEPPLLFVINHDSRGEGEGGERIEVYQLNGDRLVPLLPHIESDLLTQPNDLVAVSPNKVLVTNMAETRRKWLQNLNYVMPLSKGNVVLFTRDVEDGPWTGSRAFRPVRLANGIGYEARHDRFLVAELPKKRIRVLKPNPADPRALLVDGKPIRLAGRPDNFSRSQDGSFLVAAHPSAWKFLRHVLSASNDAPTEVYRIRLSPRMSTLIFEHRGGGPNAVSTAAEFADALYLGQVFDGGVYSCGP